MPSRRSMPLPSGARVLLACLAGSVASGSMCPGSLDVSGHGPVVLTNAGWSAGGLGSQTRLVRRGGAYELEVNLHDRAYFSHKCTEKKYLNTRYVAMPLLGKRIRYTTHINGTGCGCNVAMYLVAMSRNTKASDCGEYYCDANKVCGVHCTEIDIQEANLHAWHSTIHSAYDKYGMGGGYGGGKGWDGPRDFLEAEYGPGGKCIDTRLPFQVTAAFPVDESGVLLALEVTLTQEGKSCPLHVRVGDYPGMAELSNALRDGMTPVVSYWESRDMGWMDGEGVDGLGPCSRERTRCTESIKFYDFEVQPLPEPCTIPGGNCRISGCCRSPGLQCFEKNLSWAECKESCLQGTSHASAEAQWTCRPLGNGGTDGRSAGADGSKAAEQEVPPADSQVTPAPGEDIPKEPAKEVDGKDNSLVAKAALERSQGRHKGSEGWEGIHIAEDMDGSLSEKPSSATNQTAVVHA